MKTIQTGSKYKIYDDNIRTYDRIPSKTFDICFNDQEGFYLVERTDLYISEKVYGVHLSKAEKVLRSFHAFERNLGVILSGAKGIGKSMFAKILCMYAVDEDLPVIVVDAYYKGIARFLDAIDQECIVLFDEFDKTYRSDYECDYQSELLSLFDGTSNGKKLFIVTCNNLRGLNDFIVNRPGRFHYHFRFDYPTPSDIQDYLRDKLEPCYHDEIEKVIEFSKKISLNYDCLRAIAFELNSGNRFSDAISDLNIIATEDEEYKVYLAFEDGSKVHNLRFVTNLYDYDGAMTPIRFYNNDGNFILTAFFDKKFVTYDAVRDRIFVPPHAIKIHDAKNDERYYDEDDCDDMAVSEMPRFRNLKVTHMMFTKRTSKNLHYVI